MLGLFFRGVEWMVVAVCSVIEIQLFLWLHVIFDYIPGIVSRNDCEDVYIDVN